MEKFTAELNPGDVIAWADFLDVVIRVEWPDTEKYPRQKVATLHFFRDGQATSVSTGMMAKHKILHGAP